MAKAIATKAPGTLHNIRTKLRPGGGSGSVEGQEDGSVRGGVYGGAYGSLGGWGGGGDAASASCLSRLSGNASAPRADPGYCTVVRLCIGG